MRLTNKHGLPQTLVNAIERDPYSMGDARISVTGLLRPPRITLLTKKHSPEIESDVADHIYSLLGRAIHKILEDGGDEEHLTEERLYAEVRGWRISGAIDLQKIGEDRVAITDYNSTSAYAVMGEKPEWESQLNTYRWLIQQAKGWTADRLAICAIVRDWNRHKAREDENYPQAPAVMVPIRVWSMEEAGRFVEERVRLHQSAIALTDMGDEPPLCSDEDRWMRPAKWEVWRPGNKRPTRVFGSVEETEKFVGPGNAYKVVERPGEPIRCTNNYCQVAPWCSQYARWAKEQS